MPDEDNAQQLTPADQRRRRRVGIAVFGLFLLVVLGILVTTVLSVNDGRNYVRLVHQFGLERYLLPLPPAPPSIKLGRLRNLSPRNGYPAWLVATPTQQTARFSRASILTPEDNCLALGGADGAKPIFTSSDQGWECMYFKKLGDMPDAPSLFVQVRGSPSESFRSFRMKLSLTNDAEQQAVITDAIEAIGRFGLPATQETLSYLAGRIGSLSDFSSSIENYRLTFSREIIDPRRYNLIILRQPETTACAEIPALPIADRDAIYSLHMQFSCLRIRAIKTQGELQHAS